MKLAEVLEVIRYGTTVQLHSGKDGKLIAKTRKTLEAYRDVNILSVDCKLDLGRDHSVAIPYLYVWGASGDIEAIKNAKLKEE